MEKTESKPIVIGTAAVPFKFELSQLVEVRISDEWGGSEGACSVCR